MKDAIISIENGKIKVELPKEIKTAITVNVSNELGGVEGKEVVCVWKDTQVFDIATDAKGNATWKYVAEKNNTNSGSNQVATTESSSSLPQTGDMTFYALLTSLFASMFSAGVFGRKKMMEKKLGNRKH